MITIWGRLNAFSVQKTLWMLAEVDQPFTLVESGGPHGPLDTPAFRALNPATRLPVIDDAGAVLWESNAIIRYLAARYGGERLWPADPFTRSLGDRWMDWSLATLEPAFMKLFWGYYRTPETQRNQPFIDAAMQECARSFGLLDGVLENQPFLSGHEPGMGDIAAGASLYRYFHLGIATPELPNLRRWYERLGERDAYRTYIMRPFDALYGRPS